jgi:2-C-methyl-D-erythritol 2,4-cyclodiphosphate synthase/2-C-methyl-D-erythritol 4-phosphate cytidylyltransferase
MNKGLAKMNKPIVAVIPAFGVGLRFGRSHPKQLAELNGKSILAWSIDALCQDVRVEKIYVVLPKDYWADILWSEWNGRVIPLAQGGETRASTVRKALEHILTTYPKDTWVLVHDAVRPLLSQGKLTLLINTVLAHQQGGILALPLSDTLKKSDGVNRIIETLDRTHLWQAQTPQMFSLGLLHEALINFAQATDEASAMEQQNYSPLLVTGEPSNIKITYPLDLKLAQQYLSFHKPESKSIQKEPEWRVGQGMDVHALVAGRSLILGGVLIPYAKGLAGHSDADVLIHALIDALLGAASLGDIGRHFPDTDMTYEGANSRHLLIQVVQKVRQAGWAVQHADITIVAEAPKMVPYWEDIRNNLVHDLSLHADQISLKATTTEKLGFLGRKEGIACFAVCTLKR